MSTARIQYIPALDGLRAIGIGLVLVTHASKPGYLPGGYGVDVFFVLSGFLITTLLIVEWGKTHRVAFGTFWLRRLVRLWPALLAFLLVSMIIGLLLFPGERGKTVVETIGAAFYLTPFTERFIGVSPFYGHLWTLAYEEYFYLLWPIIFVVFMKLRLHWKLQATIMIGGGTLLYLARVYSGFFIGNSLPMFRIGGIAIGCGIAILIAHTTVRGNARVLAYVGVGCLIAAWVLSSSAPLFSLNPMLAAGGAVAIIYSILAPGTTLFQRLLETRPMVYIGQISYEIYLWHPTILVSCALLVGATENMVWFWAYPLAFIVAAATHRAFKPLQRMLRQRLSSRQEARDQKAANSAAITSQTPAT